MRTLLTGILMLPLLGGAAGADDGFRCGNRLASVGDSKSEVQLKCGAPAARDVHVEARGEGPAAVTVAVEVWTYHLGAKSFLRLVTFENGRLTQVETGGHGS